MVKGCRYSDDTLDEVETLIRQYLGDGLRIDVEFGDNIEMMRRGKVAAG